MHYSYKEAAGCRICDIARRYPQFPRGTISWHARKDVMKEEVFDKCVNNPGRPQKLQLRNKRAILRTIPKSCEEAQ